MARIFISYKRADKNIVFPIKDKIEKALGERCWIDTKGVESDAQFVEDIMKAIDEAEIVLFMYSHHHMQIKNYKTDWTIREINYAQECKKHIVFVCLDNTPLISWFSFMFPNQQLIDATSQEAMDQLYVSLRNWLNIEPSSVDSNHTEQKAVTQPILPDMDKFEYYYNDDKQTASFTSIGDDNRAITAVHIPSTTPHDGKTYKVTSIGGWAFSGCHSLEHIDLPDTITEIGYGAFVDCTKLREIVIPRSVTNINPCAFDQCDHLESIQVSPLNEVYSIREGMLLSKERNELIRCLISIQGVCIIPEGITGIRQGAFHECSKITSLHIPESVTQIDNHAFEGCDQLESFVVSDNNPVYSSDNGILYHKRWHSLMMCPRGKQDLLSFSIPEGITTIDAAAFKNCTSLISIIIPDHVTRIESSAFEGCENLASILLSENIKEIGSGAFENCTKLKNITIPNGVRTIGNSLFDGCRCLESVSIPDHVSKIDNYAFYGCVQLESVVLPRELTTIGKGAFQGCKRLEGIDFPEKLTKIGNDAFRDCINLTSVVIDPVLMDIGEGVWARCDQLRAIHVAASHTQFYSEYGVLYNKDQSELIQFPAGKSGKFIIPDSVKILRKNAFIGCSQLRFLVIPDGITQIPQNAFRSCPELTIEVSWNTIVSMECGLNADKITRRKRK